MIVHVGEDGERVPPPIHDDHRLMGRFRLSCDPLPRPRTVPRGDRERNSAESLEMISKAWDDLADRAREGRAHLLKRRLGGGAYDDAAARGPCQRSQRVCGHAKEV
jgi:hypothetical protein